jgi:hypothetical protein
MRSKEQLDTFLRQQWSERGIPLADGQRIGISVAEIVAHSVERNTKQTAPLVDLWVAILDELISWETSLFTVFYLDDDSRITPLTNFDRSIVALLMKIIADSLAIRQLFLSGFDTSARTLLRSTAEYMEVFVAILGDPALANEFVKTDSPEGAQSFWWSHLAKGKIRKKIAALWQKRFSREMAADIVSWSNQSNTLLSGVIHPSLAGGLFTGVPFKTTYTVEGPIGVWGEKAEVSAYTVSIYAEKIFPVLFLYPGFPFADFGNDFDTYMARGRLEYDVANKLHQHVEIGRDILARLIISLLLIHDDDAEHFPQIDWSIWGRQG